MQLLPNRVVKRPWARSQAGAGRGCADEIDGPWPGCDHNKHTSTAEAAACRGVRWSPASDVAGFSHWLHSNDHDMDPDPHKHSDSQTNDKRRASQQSAATSSLQAAVGTEPDNKYYEVEAILDGPRKRREHLFKYCYKVRWKGYGSDADTWQPVADLANVQDMIEDYKKERAMKQREKGKKKPEEKHIGIRTRGRSSSQSQVVSSSDDDSDDDKRYDPVYGTVKDKFWKDLELGRHQNHAQLFSGDMYSKVKGCRRAAHADAVANIQRHQQLLSKAQLLSTNQPSSSTTTKPSPKPIAGNRQSMSKSYSLSSKSPHISGRTKSPKHSPVSRVRKRSIDPFSAKGYTSAKRSRRSKETKIGIASPEDERSEALTTVPASSTVTSPDESTTDIETDTGSSCVLPSNQHSTGLSDLATVGATEFVHLCEILHLGGSLDHRFFPQERKLESLWKSLVPR